MDCIFFDSKNGRCITEPNPTSEAYKPEDDILEGYCKTESFDACPRLRACLKYLNASKGS